MYIIFEKDLTIRFVNFWEALISIIILSISVYFLLSFLSENSITKTAISFCSAFILRVIYDVFFSKKGYLFNEIILNKVVSQFKNGTDSELQSSTKRFLRVANHPKLVLLQNETLKKFKELHFLFEAINSTFIDVKKIESPNKFLKEIFCKSSKILKEYQIPKKTLLSIYANNYNYFKCQNPTNSLIDEEIYKLCENSNFLQLSRMPLHSLTHIDNIDYFINKRSELSPQPSVEGRHEIVEDLIQRVNSIEKLNHPTPLLDIYYSLIFIESQHIQNNSKMSKGKCEYYKYKVIQPALSFWIREPLSFHQLIRDLKIFKQLYPAFCNDKIIYWLFKVYAENKYDDFVKDFNKLKPYWTKDALENHIIIYECLEILEDTLTNKLNPNVVSYLIEKSEITNNNIAKGFYENILIAIFSHIGDKQIIKILYNRGRINYIIYEKIVLKNEKIRIKSPFKGYWSTSKLKEYIFPCKINTKVAKKLIF